jgi:Kdo2-lipid IVA lauroyltransferase/acyltransferase
MNTLIYWFGKALIAFLQTLPLTWVARLGRAGGALAYWFDARHRRVALKNLTMCFGGEKSPAEIRTLAKENFRRIGENYASAVKTISMSLDQLRPHLEHVGGERLLPPRRVINAGGHFGNFELYARFSDIVAGYQAATTYRALNQPALNRLMEELRSRSNCLFFERRSGAPLLRAAMNQPAIILGLQIDQHGGDHGLRLPFLGHDCSTNPSPAVFALRYNCEVYAAICYRIGLAKWRLELGEQIPTRENGHPRQVEDIMRDVLRLHEAAVLRDPANWFWVHRRWKPAPQKTESREPKVEANPNPP